MLYYIYISHQGLNLVFQQKKYEKNFYPFFCGASAKQLHHT